jgi:hypothetical protein
VPTSRIPETTFRNGEYAAIRAAAASIKKYQMLIMGSSVPNSLANDCGEPMTPMIPDDAMSGLQQFDKAAEQSISYFLKTLEASLSRPPIVYHYTNDAGLRGILESGKLWLTDMFNLNDPSELRHGLSHVVRILMAKAAANGSDDGKALAQKFEGFLTEGAYQKIAHHFVLSFSAVGDDLGQWRAYADNGRGYALGFDAQEIMRAFKSPTGVAIPNNATFPITYDDGKCIKIHEEVIELMFGLIARGEKMEAGSKREYFNHLFALLATHAFRVALAFKHEAYNNEQEIRFVEMHPKELPPTEIKIRSRPYSLVKYRECDWRTVAPKALKRVVIGPSAVAERSRAHQFLMDCLSAFHYEDVVPFRSAIPYRAM